MEILIVNAKFCAIHLFQISAIKAAIVQNVFKQTLTHTMS